MQTTANKNKLVVVITSIFLLLTTLLMFCGCNTTQTISTTKMKNVYNDFVEKIETFTSSTAGVNNTSEEEEIPQEPTLTSQTILGIPDSKYYDINNLDNYGYEIQRDINDAMNFTNTFLQAFIPGYFKPIQNAMNSASLSFNLTNVYIDNDDVNYTAVCYFDFDQKSSTLIADYICIPKHDDTQYGTLHTKLLLTISNDTWTQAKIYHTMSGNQGNGEDVVVLIGIINDTESTDDIQSFYRVQKDKNSNEVVFPIAIEYKTNKIATRFEFDWMTDAEQTEFFADLFPYNDTMLQYQDFIQIPIA